MMLRRIVAALLTLFAAHADASPHRTRHRRHRRSTRTAPAALHPPRVVTVRPPLVTPARPALGAPSTGCAPAVGGAYPSTIPSGDGAQALTVTFRSERDARAFAAALTETPLHIGRVRVMCAD